MAFQLPKGLPRLSDVTSMLATPENQFERMVKTTAKFDLPPGPQQVMLNFQKSLEAGKPGLPELPKAPSANQFLSQLPQLPKLPMFAGERSPGANVESKRPPAPMRLVKNSTPGYAKESKVELVKYRLTK